MLTKILRKIMPSAHARTRKELWPIVEEVNRHFEALDGLSDEEIQAKTGEFRERLQDGETLDDLLPEAYAVVKQACKRHVGQRWMAGSIEIKWVEIPYDVQIFGAIVLHQGKIAEMATGEGKTLVATMPLYLNALEGRGAHLATFNDMLARRDSQWTGRILEWLGITVGCIQQEIEPQQRREMYACDVTYGQSSEFGFDYLRDNMASSARHLVQGARSKLSQAVVDEILETLGEEARVVTDRFQTFLVDVPQGRVDELLQRFGGRFSLESISVAWPGAEAPLALGGPPARLPKFDESFEEPYVETGRARMRFQFQPRDHRYAIVDEVDSLLIDEARTPLIISGQVERSTQRFEQMRPHVENLSRLQAKIVGDLVREAEELLKSDDPDKRYQAGLRLLQVKKGMPKNRRYTKLVAEPEIARLVGKCENDFIVDQKSKMGEKSMGWVEEELYFVIDEKGHSVDLTEQGREAVSPDNPDRFLLADVVEQFSLIEGDASLSEAEKEEKKRQVSQDNDIKTEELHNISQLLRAYTLFEKEVEYVIQDGKVVIVDEFTGRPQPGRRYSDGLHQAIEAKERVKIEKESQTLASITIQNYFRMYDKLAGMTGTAETEAAEFGHTYKMEVVVIPTNRPIRRLDEDDVIYRTRREKYNAIVEEVTRLNQLGLPVLIGTASVSTSELLSRMLKRTGISHAVLNAKYLEREAEIVSKAGQKGAVTIATNMAGRGTDIKLGEGVIRKDEQGEIDYENAGLQIVGSERHEARRIDRQLRGRSGRQGDPGRSRFFLSLEDDLMRLFGSDRIAGVMQKLGMEEGEDIRHPFITKAITRAQRKIEEINFERRKKTLDYDNVMNKQRETIYGLRREVLTSENLDDVLLDLCYDAVGSLLPNYRDEDPQRKGEVLFDYEGLENQLRSLVPFIDTEDLPRPQPEPDDAYLEAISQRLEQALEFKRQLLGPELCTELIRMVVLRAIDMEWRDHLSAIDELREGIHLRSYAQLDPLVEYQREATLMFQQILVAVQRMVLEHFFRANVVVDSGAPQRTSNVASGRGAMEPVAAEEDDREPAMAGAATGAATNRGDAPARPATFRRDQPKVGRNDPCPCGSGKKFKKCCGA